MKILITGVGGVTPRSFAQALKKYSRYKSYDLIGTDSNPYALGLYMPLLFDKSYLIPDAEDSAYWHVVEKIVADEEVKYAVISPETEVIAWAKKSMEGGLPCKAILPEYHLAIHLADKALVSGVLEPYGLAPKSFVIKLEDADDEKKFKLPYPFWVRSTSGSSGLGSLKINHAEELKTWMSINPEIKRFMVSEYLPGRNFACKMLYYRGKLIRSAVAERIMYVMSKVAPSGITGNTSLGRLLNNSDVFNVARKAMDIIMSKTQSSKHGFFTVDLKEDQCGIPKVTEVNIRSVAFVQCYAAAGANFPEDVMRLLDDDPTFDYDFKLYKFEPGMIFLRDVDEQPILIKESQLTKFCHKAG